MKILFWEENSKNPFDGHYWGDIIPADEIEEAISLFEFPIIVWEDVPGEKADELNARLPENIGDLTEYELEKLLDEIVGSEGERAHGVDDIYPVKDCLSFDLNEGKFFDLGIVPTFPVHRYVRNSNWTYAVFDEDSMSQYEFEVVDFCNLDYQEKGNTDFTYGGMGNHARLEKVRDVDGQGYLLKHFWSQWAGEELDCGYILTEEEALEELADHPEIKEIRAWLREA